MKIFNEVLNGVTKEKPEIIIDAISELNEEVSIDSWIEFLSAEYSKKFAKLDEALNYGGLSYQTIEDECSKLSALRRNAEQYKKMKQQNENKALQQYEAKLKEIKSLTEQCTNLSVIQAREISTSSKNFDNNTKADIIDIKLANQHYFTIIICEDLKVVTIDVKSPLFHEQIFESIGNEMDEKMSQSQFDEYLIAAIAVCKKYYADKIMLIANVMDDIQEDIRILSQNENKK